MEKKELLMNIIDVFDENNKLKEENRLLKIQAGLDKISGTKTEIKEELTPEENLTHLLKKEHIEGLYSLKDSAKNAISAGIGANDWIKGLDSGTLVSWHDEYLEFAGLATIKKYFKAELIEYYNKIKDEREV